MVAGPRNQNFFPFNSFQEPCNHPNLKSRRWTFETLRRKFKKFLLLSKRNRVIIPVGNLKVDSP
jgi:hypothetical protein